MKNIKEKQWEVCTSVPTFSQRTTMNEFEREFFERLEEKLDDIFPKTNQDNPEIPSEGNRSGAISFNAYANIIFRDILRKLIAKQNKKLIKIIKIQMNEIIAGMKLLKSNNILTKKDNENINGQLQALSDLISTIKKNEKCQ